MIIFCWRITKYDPKYRNQNGNFFNNEWTSYSDIGYTFDDTRLTYEIYKKIEDLYINAILLFMESNNISALLVTCLEKSKKLKADTNNSIEMTHLFKAIKDNTWIEKENIRIFCKLILRDKLWCKLINNEKMFVHFGWDFYMYIGSSSGNDNAIKKIEESGLFVESFESPYTT